VDFNANSLLAGLLVSSVGFVLFMYGRKMRRFPQLVAGFVLLVYPYFISSVALMLGIAVALIALLWAAVRLGW
jgi:hypothetical protein